MVTLARLDTPRPPAPLTHVGQAHPFRLKRRNVGINVEVFNLYFAAVDDVDDVLHRNGGLRDVGGDDNFSEIGFINQSKNTLM